VEEVDAELGSDIGLIKVLARFCSPKRMRRRVQRIKGLPHAVASDPGHGARISQGNPRQDKPSRYQMYPREIRSWIRFHGGLGTQNLILRGRELMAHPICK
jgi:hypothetical protein